MRKAPKFKAEYNPEKAEKRDGYLSQTREYKLITPLFGGGVTPGEADPLTVIRPTEIKGHLRFWWRATRSAKFNGSLDEMKKAENMLWGGMGVKDEAFPSKVIIQLLECTKGSEFETTDNNGNKIKIYDLKSQFGYVAFPLRDTEKSSGKNRKYQTIAKKVLQGISFKICIEFPKVYEEEIAAALWAWETFGGIGARTRRGFGALQLSNLIIDNIPQQISPLPARSSELRTYLLTELKKHVSEGPPFKDIPSLSRNGESMVTTKFFNSPLNTWEYMIQKLRNFRQDRDFNRETRRPGRNHWPEPDAIRRLTKRTAQKHKQPINNINLFPRADFGLPIIFKFKDEDNGDPKQTTLEGAIEGASRLASPIIIRPLVCAHNKSVGIAIRLEAPTIPPNGLILKDAPNDPKVESDLSELTDEELDSIRPLQTCDDPIKEFLRILEEDSRR